MVTIPCLGYPHCLNHWEALQHIQTWHPLAGMIFEVLSDLSCFMIPWYMFQPESSVVHSNPNYLPWQSSGPAITKAIPASHLCQGRELGWNVTGEEQQIILPCSISSKTSVFLVGQSTAYQLCQQSVRREWDCITWVLIPKRCLLLKAVGCGSQLSMFHVQSIIWQSLMPHIGKFQVLVVLILHLISHQDHIFPHHIVIVLVFVFKQGILIFIIPCITWEVPTQTLHSCSCCWADITKSQFLS